MFFSKFQKYHMILIIYCQNTPYVSYAVTSPCGHVPLWSRPPVVTSPCGHVTLWSRYSLVTLPCRLKFWCINKLLLQLLSEPSGSVGSASDFWARSSEFNTLLGQKKTKFLELQNRFTQTIFYYFLLQTVINGNNRKTI